MQLSFEITTQLAPNQIWPFYVDVQKWLKWDQDLENISLNGEFAVGTTGEMKMKDMPPITFTLISVEPNTGFTDSTIIPEVGEILFGHHLNIIEDKTVVRHTVEFKPADPNMPKAEALKMLKQIFSDTPEAVLALLKVAQTNEQR